MNIHNNKMLSIIFTMMYNWLYAIAAECYEENNNKRPKKETTKDNFLSIQSDQFITLNWY